jgi:hypothetical protein
VEADFFGLPGYSADGAWIGYIAARAAPDQTSLALMLARHDGSNATVYAEGEIGLLAAPRWLPQDARFLIQRAPGEFWIGGPDLPLRPFPAVEVACLEIRWAGPQTFVFSAPASDQFTLNYGMLDADRPLRTVITLDTYPIFDAVVP